MYLLSSKVCYAYRTTTAVGVPGQYFWPLIEISRVSLVPARATRVREFGVHNTQEYHGGCMGRQALEISGFIVFVRFIARRSSVSPSFAALRLMSRTRKHVYVRLYTYTL